MILPGMRSFWTTADLRALGKSQRDIRRAVERGLLDPVRRGHFAVPGTDRGLIEAVRIGGVLTGTSASRLRQLWTPPDPRLEGPPDPRSYTPVDPRLYVAVPRNAPRLHDRRDHARAFTPSDDVVVCWTDPAQLSGTRHSGLASPLLMLEHVFAAQPVDRALAVTDSALRHRHLRTADLPALASRLPSHQRRAALAATARCDSGIETIGRYRLGLLGLDVEVLVRLSAIGTVDLLVEGWLIVEMDGREFHEDEQFERDRRRDLESAANRYRTLRFSWRQVMFQWPDVERAVLAALASR